MTDINLKSAVVQEAIDDGTAKTVIISEATSYRIEASVVERERLVDENTIRSVALSMAITHHGRSYNEGDADAVLATAGKFRAFIKGE
jgi:hypothetical protein